MNAEITNATTEIIACYRRLGETRKNNPDCYRHDLFRNRDLIDRKSPQYAWQWNFTNKEYEEIKTLLSKKLFKNGKKRIV